MAPPSPAYLTFYLNHDLQASRALKAGGLGTSYDKPNLLTEWTQQQVIIGASSIPVRLRLYLLIVGFSTDAHCFSAALQLVLWAALLWPCLFGLGVPLECADDQGNLSRCSSISQEKLLDRVIQHAELIYRVSEESCSLFVSKQERL